MLCAQPNVFCNANPLVTPTPEPIALVLHHLALRETMVLVHIQVYRPGELCYATSISSALAISHDEGSVEPTPLEIVCTDTNKST